MAEVLAERTGGAIVASDRLRKRMAGLAPEALALRVNPPQIEVRRPVYFAR
ncbi:MAG: hypothetical protein V3T33_10745 [Myxococcota bacterium]